jgi:hypothetical protein
LGVRNPARRAGIERFEGFVLTKFDGKKIKIAGGKVV